MKIFLQKKSKLLLTVALSAMVICAFSIFLIKKIVFTDHPKSVLTEEQKKTELESILGRPFSGEVEPDSVLTHTNAVLTFSYPSSARFEGASPQSATQSAALIDSFSFSVPRKRVFVSLTVRNQPDLKKIQDSPAVQLRLHQPTDYQLFQTKIDQATVSGFVKEGDQNEKSCFFIYQGNFVSFVVSGASSENVDEVFTTITNSMKLH